MRTSSTRIGWVGLAVVLTTVSAGCNTRTGRFFRWMDADMNDIGRFPSRTIGAGEARFDFEAATPGRYDAVFAPVPFTEDDQAREQDFETFLEQRDTHAFLVIRRDTLVYERYFQGRERGSVETTFSVAKSLVSIATGVAVDQDRIGGVTDPITRYLPELSDRDPAFDALTVGHLLTMTSGIRFKPGKMPWGDEATSYYDPNLRSVALRRDLSDTPGERFQYNPYAPIVLGLALERATGVPLTRVLEEHLWQPIGAEFDASWSLDSDKHAFEKMESGFNAAAIDLAKIGRLYLREGDWNGRQVVSKEWVRASIRPDSAGGRSSRYGYYWWLRPTEQEVTRFYAEGRFGQFIYVVPDRDLVIVRTGSSSGDVGWPSVFELVVDRIDDFGGS